MSIQESKSTFVSVTYLCINLRAPASRFSLRSAVLVMITFIWPVSRLFIENHENINVNSKINIVYTLTGTRVKNKTEKGTRNKTVKVFMKRNF